MVVEPVVNRLSFSVAREDVGVLVAVYRVAVVWPPFVVRVVRVSGQPVWLLEKSAVEPTPVGLAATPAVWVFVAAGSVQKFVSADGGRRYHLERVYSD